jgi:hypothetical protein
VDFDRTTRDLHHPRERRVQTVAVVRIDLFG